MVRHGQTIYAKTLSDVVVWRFPKLAVPQTIQHEIILVLKPIVAWGYYILREPHMYPMFSSLHPGSDPNLRCQPAGRYAFCWSGTLLSLYLLLEWEALSPGSGAGPAENQRVIMFSATFATFSQITWAHNMLIVPIMIYHIFHRHHQHHPFINSLLVKLEGRAARWYPGRNPCGPSSRAWAWIGILRESPGHSALGSGGQTCLTSPSQELGDPM